MPIHKYNNAQFCDIVTSKKVQTTNFFPSSFVVVNVVVAGTGMDKNQHPE
jgi:hypothetical protein